MVQELRQQQERIGAKKVRIDDRRRPVNACHRTVDDLSTVVMLQALAIHVGKECETVWKIHFTKRLQTISGNAVRYRSRQSRIRKSLRQLGASGSGARSITVANQQENSLGEKFRDAFLCAAHGTIAVLHRQQGGHVTLERDSAMQLKQQHTAEARNHYRPGECTGFHIQLIGEISLLFNRRASLLLNGASEIT